jgi:hypothetical protein
MTQILPHLIREKVKDYLNAIYLLQWKSRIKPINNEYDKRVEYDDDRFVLVKQPRTRYIIGTKCITYNYVIHDDIKMQSNFQIYNYRKIWYNDVTKQREWSGQIITNKSNHKVGKLSPNY